MNIDEMIELLQAFKDGKKIETRARQSLNKWILTRTPLWDFYGIEYRVKPEPREFYLSKYDIENGNRITVCHDGSHNQDFNHWVKVREVLDNE